MGVAIVMKHIATETTLWGYASAIKAISFTERVVLTAVHK